ncbi:hypothetical protein [Ottowia oryzae]
MLRPSEKLKPAKTGSTEKFVKLAASGADVVSHPDGLIAVL